MLHIVTDSSSMLSEQNSPYEAFHILPLHVQCGEQSFLDGVEIQADDICRFCQDGGMPISSQPSIGEKLDAYDAILADPDNTILDITIADGLSGTYQTALMAQDQCIDPSRVTVCNSHTLAGPQRELVLCALKKRDEGCSVQEIVSMMDDVCARDISMVAVSDCAYLGRSGRVSTLVGQAGKLLHLIPVAEKVDEGRSLHMMKTARTMKKAIGAMISNLQAKGADESFTFCIAHSGIPDAAECARKQLAELFPQAKIQVDPLCALFVVHGGPGALSIQAIPSF